MRKIGISLIVTSIPMFILAACGFTNQFSSPIISELAKYCFMSWCLLGLIGFILIKLAKESKQKE
jgi:hypothetical protein